MDKKIKTITTIAFSVSIIFLLLNGCLYFIGKFSPCAYDGIIVKDGFPFAYDINEKFAIFSLLVFVALIIGLVIGLNVKKCKIFIPITLFLLSIYALIDAIILKPSPVDFSETVISLLMFFAYLLPAVFSLNYFSPKLNITWSIFSKMLFVPILFSAVVLLYNSFAALLIADNWLQELTIILNNLVNTFSIGCLMFLLKENRKTEIQNNGTTEKQEALDCS